MEVVPLGHALGAEIRGVDITDEIGDNLVAAIREAWHRHHIIVFREAGPASYILETVRHSRRS